MDLAQLLDWIGFLVRATGTLACAGFFLLGFYPWPKSKSLWGEAWRRLRSNRTAMAGWFVIFGLGILAFGAEWIAPHDPTRMGLDRTDVCVLFEPSHPLGTDTKGRDNLSRLIHGARISLQVGMISQAVAAGVGILVGLVSGFYGGWIDLALMRLTDVMLAFPFLLFVMTIVAVLGTPPLWLVFVVIGLVSWPNLARVVRAQVLSLKEKEFIEAARALGASDRRILFLHLLPNCMPPIIVQLSLGMAQAILSEAGLSFLGFGAQPPLSSWGLMVAQGQEALETYWWVPIYPGLAIMASVFAFNLLGDGLRDALDPRMKS